MQVFRVMSHLELVESSYRVAQQVPLGTHLGDFQTGQDDTGSGSRSQYRISRLGH